MRPQDALDDNKSIKYGLIALYKYILCHEMVVVNLLNPEHCYKK